MRNMIFISLILMMAFLIFFCKWIYYGTFQSILGFRFLFTYLLKSWHAKWPLPIIRSITFNLFCLLFRCQDSQLYVRRDLNSALSMLSFVLARLFLQLSPILRFVIAIFFYYIKGLFDLGLITYSFDNYRVNKVDCFIDCYFSKQLLLHPRKLILKKALDVTSGLKYRSGPLFKLLLLLLYSFLLFLTPTISYFTERCQIFVKSTNKI